MSTTLSYGFKQQQTGDAGTSWFADINTNNQLLNDHNHNGLNSALISGSGILPGIATVSSGSWSFVSTGKYSQAITFPTGYTLSNSIPMVTDASGNVIMSNIDYLSSTTFTIYSITGTDQYTVYFK